MHKLTFIAATGALAACSLLPDQAPLAADPLSALERACLEDPGNALTWERLGEQLLARGETGRAGRMLGQARSLRQHTLAGDHVVLRSALAEARVSAAPWPADLARTELHALGPALLELRRIAAPVAGARPAAAARLEISNGNGVTGLAAAWGRALAGSEWTVVRLSNAQSFDERSSRIEYRAVNMLQARRLAQRIEVRAVEADLASRPGGPDLRLILGRDLRTLK